MKQTLLSSSSFRFLLDIRDTVMHTALGTTTTPNPPQSPSAASIVRRQFHFGSTIVHDGAWHHYKPIKSPAASTTDVSSIQAHPSWRPSSLQSGARSPHQHPTHLRSRFHSSTPMTMSGPPEEQKKQRNTERARVSRERKAELKIITPELLRPVCNAADWQGWKDQSANEKRQKLL